MLIAYLDESYGPHAFVLGGVVVDGPSAVRLGAALEGVVARAAARFGISPEAELHAHQVATGKGGWSVLRGDATARVQVLAEAVAAIAGSGARVLAVQVAASEVGEPLRTAQAVGVAYRHALVRGFRTLGRFAEAMDEHVLVVADRVQDADPHRRALAEYRDGGSRRIVDSVQFGDSASSRLLQAADVVAYVARRAEDPTVRSARARRAALAMVAQWDGVRLRDPET
jgi:hypothetical protein